MVAVRCVSFVTDLHHNDKRNKTLRVSKDLTCLSGGLAWTSAWRAGHPVVGLIPLCMEACMPPKAPDYFLLFSIRVVRLRHCTR